MAKRSLIAILLILAMLVPVSSYAELKLSPTFASTTTRALSPYETKLFRGLEVCKVEIRKRDRLLIGAEKKLIASKKSTSRSQKTGLKSAEKAVDSSSDQLLPWLWAGSLLAVIVGTIYVTCEVSDCSN